MKNLHCFPNNISLGGRIKRRVDLHWQTRRSRIGRNVARLLLRHLTMFTPAVETLDKAARFFVLQSEEEFAGPVRLLVSHVLDVHLELM